MSISVAAGSTRSRAAGLAIALGCLALAARPVSYGALGATVMLGALGAWAPATPNTAGRARRLGVFVLGTAAFLGGRALGAPIGIRFTYLGTAGVALAAVAEELFFRRYVYGVLVARGAGLAVGVSSVLFAVVHVPTYGLRALPVDLAAGVLLGWQRWAAGTWTVPAATHVIANLLQMG